MIIGKTIRTKPVKLLDKWNQKENRLLVVITWWFLFIPVYTKADKIL